MWELIYKYAFVTIQILAIIVALYRIGKGKHMREETPLGNAIAIIMGMLWTAGFLLFFW